MTDVEVVIFNDKSWVRLTEYQKIKEENEQLKARISYLEDNLRVARKDSADLRNDIANGLKEFIKEKPSTSLRFLANKETKEENEQLKARIERMKCCYLCKNVYDCAFADVFNFHCCEEWELAE